MSTIDVHEQITDEGHESASQAARTAAEIDAEADAKRKRAPVYQVFELRTLLYVDDPSDLETGGEHCDIAAWVPIAENVAGATDRKAIESVIGTHEHPVEGFDADRRLLPHIAVLTRHWNPRTRTRIVEEPTPEERAELERRLAPKVREEWT